MFEKLINFSIEKRWFIVLGTLIMAVIGFYNYHRLPIDAVPDITNVQVQINTDAEGYAPFEVEQRITFPIETALFGLPSLDYTRSLSKYGLSQVTVVFKDGTDIYFARQLISERLAEARVNLPEGLNPVMGPIATGLGEIFMYTVEEKEGRNSHSPTDLRTVQDWIIKPQLRTVPGVVDVNTIGGYQKKYIISPKLDKLFAYGLTFDDIAKAVSENNSNQGAGYIEKNGEQFLIRAPGQLKNIEEIKLIPIITHKNVPVYLKDLAEISVGSELRTGAATENGKEVVLGTVFMLIGENSRIVSQNVSKKMEEINRSLPESLEAKTVYDRTNLVNATIGTVKKNLFEGALLVIIVLFLMLGSFRAALITACVIPLSMLFTITGMVNGKISGNLMSLGALDFGLIVDGAVILVENCMRRLSLARHAQGRALSHVERLSVIKSASLEVRQATMFGELIIMIVYLPILSLTGVEGKMFHPMAFTVILALMGAVILSLTFVPAAVAILVSGEVSEKESRLFQKIKGLYQDVLRKAFELKTAVICGALFVFVISVFIGSRLGTEFIPSLDEGDIALHALRIPGTSLTQAVQMQHSLERKIKELPEVKNAFAKIGTAEIATDPMPPNVTDGFVMLKPRNEWPNPGLSKQDLVAKLEETVMQVPGNNYEFTQPIQMRFNELIAGVRSDVAVKVFGDNMDLLLENANKVNKILAGVRGVADAKVEQVTGLPTINVVFDKHKLSHYGISLSSAQDVLSDALSGKSAGFIFEGDRRSEIILRLKETDRNSLKTIRELIVPLADNQSNDKETHMIPISESPDVTQPPPHFVRLHDIAEIKYETGPNQVSRENGKRRVVVTANVRGRDLGSFVEEAQEKINQNLKLPSGYWLTWGGQFEQLVSARKRLMLVVPASLVLIFILLYITLSSMKDSLLVFSGVPLAITGGILALWLRGIPLSISAGVGFIALSGVAVLNGLVMISFINNLIKSGLPVSQAVFEGSISRLRPVLMTALVASLGFVPMAFSHGTGAEVQRPLATVVIGGIISSTLLTLILLPIFYRIIHKDRQ